MEMLKMMRDFFKSYIKYRKEIKKQDEWIKKYANMKGYKVNPHWMMYTNLKIWLVETQKIFGKRYCPCFEPSGKPEIDNKMLCPCKFAEEEIKEYGTCHCRLFGRGDFTSEDFKRAEKELMREYRVKLNINGNTLDTTGMPKDKLRGLPIPDSLHQVKRAINILNGNEINVIVETDVEAENLRKFANFYGYKFEKKIKDDLIFIKLLKWGTEAINWFDKKCISGKIELKKIGVGLWVKE